MPMEKTFDAATAEPEISVRWEAADAFRAGANARPGAQPFSILLPPPNVTGSLHMGHAFNHTLMDILARWHRMQGDDVLWQPGLDHAGIATQMVVERELARTGNASRREMGREAFVAKVWEWKEQSGGTILEQSRRLGDSFDLSRNRFTMDEGFHDAVLKVFVDFYNKGLIFRGKRLVNWDPHFETAISDLEVENIEVPGHMWHFKYRLADGETYDYVEKDADGAVILRETRDYISIATTRPETMLGDGAVAVHPSDARYAPIVGKMVHLPLADRLIPIITDDYPDPDFGSGAVKITGAHDFNDYQVAQRHGLPMYRLMDTRGAMRADGPSYAEAVTRAREIAAGSPATEAEVDGLNLVPEKYRGMDRFAARAAVIADITAQGLAVTITDAAGEPVPLVEAKPITQPFGDRSKVVIEPMLTDQWYVDAATLAGPALAAVRDGRTRILPERDEKTYFHWLENIEPWCISRQLWWGHQIPVWYGAYVDRKGKLPHSAVANPDADEPGVFLEHGRWVKAFCGMSEDAVREEAENWYRARQGHRVVVRFDGEGEDAAGEFPEERSTTFVTLHRDPDVLDTWFSSGIWPIGTLGWPDDTSELRRYYPTSTLVTAHDIIFFWVARMMMMQLELVGDVPFREVYIHALVRDEKGKKMSKSLGNILDPIELIDRFGADAVRFTLTAMAVMGRDLKLSDERIAGYRNFGTKLWNAARFAEMNDCRPDPAFDPKAVTLTANKWIVGETGRLRETLDAALAAYRFNDAATALYTHVWGKVCDWYVELAKPLFDGGGAAETRATMAWVLDQCLILMHPVMPFITEALWGQIAPRAKLLCHTDWPAYGSELIDPAADAEMNWVIGLIEEVRSVRAQLHVPAGARVPLLELDLAAPQAEALERNRPLIARLARIDRFEKATEAPRGAITLAREGGTFCLPLADIIDVAAERDRLAKAIDNLGKAAASVRAKLANPAFVVRAPEDVVDEQRLRLEAVEGEIESLRGAASRLAGPS